LTAINLRVKIPRVTVISSGPDSHRVQRSREPEGSAKQNLTKQISPLRVALVEMTTELVDSVNGSVVEGSFTRQIS